MNEIQLNKPMTYNLLCIMLGEKNDSKHKAVHIKRLKQQYNIIEVGKKYSVLDIYDVEKYMSNLSYGKNKKFLEPIIYTILSEVDTNSIRCSMPKLLTTFKMVNTKFNDVKKHPDKYEEKILGWDGLSDLKVIQFTLETEKMLRPIVKNIFDDMEDKKLIIVNKIPMFVKNVWHEDFEETTNKKRVQKTYPKAYQPSDDELKSYMCIGREILDEFGYENESDLPYDLQSEFEYENNRRFGIIGKYEDYHLILNQHGIEDMIIKKNFGEFKGLFNQFIQDKILKSTRGRLKNLTDDEKRKCIAELIVPKKGDIQ